MLDCFVPRNDGDTYRHCEERSNPVNLSIIHFLFQIFLFTAKNTTFAWQKYEKII